MRAAWSRLLALLAMLAGCSSPEESFASSDAAAEAASDASRDGPQEARTDAGAVDADGGSTDAPVEASGPLPAELVWASFYSPNLAEAGAPELAALNRSPYDGFTFFVAGPYDSTAPTLAGLSPIVALVKQSTVKHVWPWAFWNRMVGAPSPSSGCKSTCPAGGPCNAITGLDLNDAQGALSAFQGQLHTALQFAKATGSPGIFVDLEPYSNYCMQNVSSVAFETGLSASAVRASLTAIGAAMADIVATDDPTAIALFAYLSSPTDTSRVEQVLVKGMLDRAVSQRYVFQVAEGGETSVGYLQTSLTAFEAALGQQQMEFAPWISAYPNLLLSSTLAPYEDITQTTGWIQAWYQANASQVMVKTIADFAPLLVTLFGERRQLVWLYGSNAAPYDEYDPDAAAPYEAVVAAARDAGR